jgi:hypothetical protein
VEFSSLEILLHVLATPSVLRAAARAMTRKEPATYYLMKPELVSLMALGWLVAGDLEDGPSEAAVERQQAGLSRFRWACALASSCLIVALRCSFYCCAG